MRIANCYVRKAKAGSDWYRQQLRFGCVAHRLVVPITLQAYGLFVRGDLCVRLPTTDCAVPISGLYRIYVMVS